MCRKLISLIFVVLVLGLASTTYGSGIMIGNFENSMDGWTLYDPNDPNISLSYSTTGATLDTKSLRIADASTGSESVIKYDVIGNGKLDAFRKNLKVSADVTRLVSEWTESGGAYCDFTLAVQAGSSVAGKEWDLWQGTTANTSWHPYDGNNPMDIIYDYSLALNQIDFDNLEYLNLIFSTNWGAFSPGGIYYLDNVQILGGGPAYDPHPSVGEMGVRRDIILSWTPGAYAKKHDVYFGTNFNDVNDANRVDPHGVLVSKDQAATTYDPPGFLEAGTTYYWRIDEVNEPNIWKGNVWNFKTLATGAGVVIGDWEKNMDGWQKGAEGTQIFDYNDRRGVTLNKYCLDLRTKGGYWTFQRPGWVDLTNMTLLIDVTMYADEWSGQWTKIDKLAVGSNLGWREFNPTAINRLTGGTAPLDWGNWNGDAYKTYSWDLSSYSDWANATQITIFIALQNPASGPGPFHLDNARLLDTRIASEPKPMDYATEVWIVPTLSWKSGKYAAKHDVYFGTDFDKVTDANRTNTLSVLVSKDQVPNNYKPGTLKLDTTYYWRVDEVNDLRAPYIWKGRVWTFMTGHYLIVDDFENYNNTSNKIQNTWIKGGSGTVGYPDPNYAEVSIVHEGAQSMPFDYNNLKSPNYSETTRTFATAQDWTTEGVKALSLWLRGHPAAVGTFVESPPGTYTMTASGTDIWDVPDNRKPTSYHDEFHYAYTKISGDCVIIAKVESVSNTDPWAKAGIMIRQSTDANSAHVMVCMTPSNGAAFQYRQTSGGASTNANQSGITTPYWIAIQRLGTTFTGACCSDGASWGSLGGIDIVMADPVYIGLALTSHNAEATCTAVFTNVSINQAPPAFTSHQDIGIKSNTAAPLYVTLQDSSQNKAMVTTNDPNLLLSTAWQRWDIALSDFTGVNKNAITKMTIGVGNKNSPQPVGVGTLYIDDIRLYLPQCIPTRLKPLGDVTNDCLVDYADLDIMAQQWLTSGSNLEADVYQDNNINLKDYALLADTWLEELLWPQ